LNITPSELPSSTLFSEVVHSPRFPLANRPSTAAAEDLVECQGLTESTFRTAVLYPPSSTSSTPLCGLEVLCSISAFLRIPLLAIIGSLEQT